jgi:predicted DsbA family dithiol-disulfide isomerase
MASWKLHRHLCVMTDRPPAPVSARLYFDFVDPLSYLVDRELRAAVSGSAVEIERLSLEVRPPPDAPTDVADPFWSGRWALARPHAEELGVALRPEGLVPWSRKAHELHAHARSLGAADVAREAIFEAFFREGRDIGRVDVLVEIARAAGLDGPEAKAVLDVDRYQADVAEARRAALAAGVAEVPTLVLGARRLKGFHNQAALSTFLDGRP